MEQKKSIEWRWKSTNERFEEWRCDEFGEVLVSCSLLHQLRKEAYEAGLKEGSNEILQRCQDLIASASQESFELGKKHVVNMIRAGLKEYVDENGNYNWDNK